MTGSKINPHATRTHCDSLDSIIAPQSIAWRQIAPEPTWLCPSGLWLEGHNQVLQVPGSQTTWYILVWFGIICYIIKHHFPTFVAKIHQNPCFFLWRSQAWLTFESHGRSGHSTVAGHRRNRRGPRISHSMQKVNWSIPVFPTWQFSYSIIPNMAIRWKKWWKRLEKCFFTIFYQDGFRNWTLGTDDTWFCSWSSLYWYRDSPHPQDDPAMFCTSRRWVTVVVSATKTWTFLKMHYWLAQENSKVNHIKSWLITCRSGSETSCHRCI